MPLSFNTREVGNVTVMQCNGRIVAGPEVGLLQSSLSDLLQHCKQVVLNLNQVVFIDSSGLGMLVRMLSRTRRMQGDLKLCNLPEAIRKVLTLTSLINLFEVHGAEDSAVLAFYKLTYGADRAPATGPRLLCVESSADVLSYLREVLGSAGYDVLTCNNLHDAVILIRATRPNLIISGENLAGSPGTQAAFRSACAVTPRVELGNEFCTLEAGRAAGEILKRVRACLQGNATSA